jgi:hypothetical protein
VPSGVERGAFSEEPCFGQRTGTCLGRRDGSGVRCAGACSGEVPVLEAAAQVSSLRPMVPTAAACAARVLAAAASPASAFACAVFLGTCVFGGAAVDEVTCVFGVWWCGGR